MAESSPFTFLRQHLDQFYPEIESFENSSVQAARTQYRTRHGASVVCWSFGRPVHVLDAILADGTRVDIEETGKTWRYRLSDTPRRWVHGAADIRPDRVTFISEKQSEYVPPVPTGHADLAFDLAADSELRERLLDEDFADTFYAFLKNGSFFKDGGDRIWSIGLSSAAGIAANLRGQGDVYTDYYPHGGRPPLGVERVNAARRILGEPELTSDEIAFEAVLTSRFAEIEALLARLSWHVATDEDRNVAATATRRDLASWEARPEGVTPDWAANLHAPHPRSQAVIRLVSVRSDPKPETEQARRDEVADQTLERRLYLLATSGRITETEYRSMVMRIDDIP